MIMVYNMKVKIITGLVGDNKEVIVEKLVNNFIKGRKIVDIKTTTTHPTSYNSHSYIVVMILYK
jgi:hypothetical protein